MLEDSHQKKLFHQNNSGYNVINSANENHTNATYIKFSKDKSIIEANYIVILQTRIPVRDFKQITKQKNKNKRLKLR